MQEKRCPVPGCDYRTTRWDSLADHIASSSDPAHVTLYEFLLYSAVDGEGRCTLCGEALPYRSKRHGITTQLKHYVEKHPEYLEKVVLSGLRCRVCERCGTYMRPVASNGELVIWYCPTCNLKYVEVVRR